MDAAAGGPGGCEWKRRPSFRSWRGDAWSWTFRADSPSAVKWVGRFSFRMSAGITATLDAPSQVQLQADTGPMDVDPELTAWSEDAEDELQAGFTEYGFVPSLGVGVGYTLPF